MLGASEFGGRRVNRSSSNVTATAAVGIAFNDVLPAPDSTEIDKISRTSTTRRRRAIELSQGSNVDGKTFANNSLRAVTSVETEVVSVSADKGRKATGNKRTATRSPAEDKASTVNHVT